MYMEFVELRNLRLKAGYSLEDMSNKLGVSKAYYWQLENGGRRLYYFLAVEIAKIFNKKPDEIFYEYFID